MNSSKTAGKEQDEAWFEEQNQVIKKIELISFIELGAVLVIGVFQYFRLKHIIESRQN